MSTSPRAFILAKSRVAAELQEVASGVDALYLSGWTKLSAELLDKLQERKELALETGKPVPFEFGREMFAIREHGWKRYRFCIEHPNGQIGLSPSERLPPLRIQPRAIFLHGVGAPEALGWFEGLLQREFGLVRLTVSRADLFADWQGWNLRGEDRHRFVCRAGTLNTYESWFELNGLVFGRREGGGLSARIYDKTAEIALKGSGAWWFDVWGGRARPNEAVHRVEFEIGRQALRQFKIDGPMELIASAGALWGYLTESWLSLRVPSADKTRSRWPVAPEWERIRSATLRASSAGLERLRETEDTQDMRRLMPALIGYLAAVGALTRSESLGDVMIRLPDLIHAHELRTGVSFGERLVRKRRRVE